jgi:purine-binding chemotaxis protein CheW
VEILNFEIETRRYALPLREVREVVRAVAITPLPGSPAAVEGVIDVRGALVPVMDLRWREQLPARAVHPREYLILVNAAGGTVAFRVDGVRQPAEIADHLIQDVRAIAPAADHIAGVAHLPDGLVLIYDLNRFLSPEEGRMLAGALSSTASSPGAREDG